ncbi:response regulator [Rubrivirga sp.]|uniref:response regulator n=1 Tax=Rubrivirga sp. TaxID=1885344 RepID=UPI003C75273C
MSAPVRIAIVEDHAVLRERLEQQLAFFEAVDLVLSSESGDAFLADLEVRSRSDAPLPDVVLMDIEMPGRDGTETTAELKRTWPDIEVLMLTVFEAEDKIFSAIQAGASGYLLKDDGPDAIVRAVLEVEAGGAPSSPLVARKLLGYVREQSSSTLRGADAAQSLRLTPRETDVLAQLIEDVSEVEIAEALGVSPHTVRTHVKNLYGKLQVHSRAQAVRAAFERGLV